MKESTVKSKLEEMIDGLSEYFDIQTKPGNLFRHYRLSKNGIKTTLSNHPDQMTRLMKSLHLETPFMNQEDYYSKEVSQLALDYVELNLEESSDSWGFESVISKTNYGTVDKFLKTVPDEKKFKRLFYESMGSMWGYFKHNTLWEKASALNSVKVKINPDIIFNNLEAMIKTFEQLPPLSHDAWDDYWDFEEGDPSAQKSDLHKAMEMIDFVDYRRTSLTKMCVFLKKHYTEDRVCKVVFDVIDEHSMNDFNDSIEEAKDLELDIDKLMIKQPKNFADIHDFLIERIDEEEIIANEEDFNLNQREDFLKLDNTKIQVLNQTMIVKVPKTRHELAIFSRKSMFDNCVGKGEGYAEQVRAGRCSIVGVFDEKNKPLYCIQTSKYSFLQATGVSNSQIPREVFKALETAITIKPELPTDFIPVEHSFIFGYSYNPKKECLYLMFRKTEYIYEYTGIDMDVYEEFAKTPYKGKMLNSVIKKYPCHRLNDKKKVA